MANNSFSVFCVIAGKIQQPQAVDTGLDWAKTVGLVDKLHNGTYEPYRGQEITNITVRCDNDGTYVDIAAILKLVAA